jgi:hypothetical protein
MKGAGANVQTCNNVSFKNIDFVDRVEGNTTTANPIAIRNSVLPVYQEPVTRCAGPGQMPSPGMTRLTSGSFVQMSSNGSSGASS